MKNLEQNMIEITNLVKMFDDHVAVDQITLNIRAGEFLTLLGPSGCGKTTTLRMIAGFEEPTSGVILLEGKHVESMAPYDRDVNTVFQSYALFPHMNVLDNVGFGLKMKKIPKEEIKTRSLAALKLVQLEEYAKRMPDQLSGGQKQRVAIARAIVNKPKVLLLDEPLGALDLKLRKQMQVELKHLQKQLGITFIYVTHDQEEALTMSDRIVVMNKGKLEQIGTAHEIYEKPTTKFVADFIGETNLFEGKVMDKLDDNLYKIAVEQVEVTAYGEGLLQGEMVYLAVRPEKMVVSADQTDRKMVFTGRFKEMIYGGAVMKIVVQIPSGKEVIINKTSEISQWDEGQELFVSWEPSQAVIMKE